MKPLADRFTVQGMFDDLADVYEAMIDWPKRLAHEKPFYRRLFERLGARSVVDVACGTGRHAAMFHGWGLRVEGADLSPAMIDRARTSFGQPDGLRWAVRAFDEPRAPAEPFDVAVLRGQLAQSRPGHGDGPSGDSADARRGSRRRCRRHSGVESVAPARRPVCVAEMPAGFTAWWGRHSCGKGDRLHLCDDQRFASVPASGPFRQMVPVPFPLQGDVLILKGVHRCGTRGYVELVVADPAGGALLRSESTPFLGLEASELEGAARDAGATTVAFYGGYADQPYDRQESVDLLMVAET